MKNILILMTFVSLFLSCSKDQNIVTDNNDFQNIFTNSKTVDNFYTISHSNISGNFSQIDITKDIKDQAQNDDKIIADNFIGEFSKNLKSINDDLNYMSFSRTQESSKSIVNSFGKTFVLRDNNKESDVEFYVPQTIVLSNKEEISEVDLDNNLTIKWNPDYSNPSSKVVVTLINRGNVPSGNSIVKIDDISYTTIVDDNGELTIGQDKLGRFQSDKNIDIVISRGNQIYLNNSALTVITSDLIPSKTKI